MLRTSTLLTAVVLLAACTPAPTGAGPVPPAPTPPAKAAGAAVVRVAVPEPGGARTPQPDISAAGIVVPPGALYVCVKEVHGERQSSVIDFAPKVGELCAKYPEMGPCQYERNVCRRGGGRVYAANGVEITLATEAEYDRKVMRVRLQSN
jgi:hypothetical protein